MTVSELDNDVAGSVILRIGDNLETGKVRITSSTWADEIIQAIFINDTKICHVGIPLADAETCSAREPPIDGIGRLVLPPKHQIRLINMMSDAKLPSILADALSGADALLLSKIFDLHGTAIRAGDGRPPLSSDATGARIGMPVETVRADSLGGKDGRSRPAVGAFAEGILEEIFLPLGDGLLCSGFDDCIGPGPGGRAIGAGDSTGYIRFDGNNAVGSDRLLIFRAGIDIADFDGMDAIMAN